MSRRRIGFSLSIAALLGATAYAPAANAAEHTTTIVRGLYSIAVTHVDGGIPTADQHPLSRFDIDGDGRDEIILKGTVNSVSTLAVRLSRTGAVERVTGFNRALGVVGDFDGDGFGDLALGDPYAPAGAADKGGAVWVFYGSPGGLVVDAAEGTPHSVQRFTQTSPTNNGYFARELTAADFDHDGRSELVIAGSLMSGRTEILRGSATGLTSAGAVSISLAGLDPTASTVDGFAAGDVTGDGYADLVVGADNGRMFLLPGSASGPRTSSLSAVAADGVGNLILNVGSHLTPQAVADVNGDGFGDVIAANSSARVNDFGYVGAVAVFYGSARGIFESRSAVVHQDSVGVPGAARDYQYFGSSVSAGDVTGDGLADVVVGTSQLVGGDTDIGSLYVFQGSHQGLRTEGAQLFTQDSAGVPGVAGAGHAFGHNMILDLDGTGPLDVLAVAPWDNTIARFLGGPAGLSADGGLDTVALNIGSVITPTLPVEGTAVSAAGASGATAAGRTALAASVPAAAAPRPIRLSAGSGTLADTVDGPAAPGSGLLPVGTPARFDLDGDGKDEEVVGVENGLRVHYSRTDRFDNLTSPKLNHDIASATAAGDFDHDGFVDLAVADKTDDAGTRSDVGGVWICRGSADGLLYDRCLHLVPGVSIAGRALAGQHFGSALAAGDLNGDGYADLAIGTPDESRPSRIKGAKVTAATGSVTVMYGSASGLRPEAAKRMTQRLAAAYDQFGQSLAIGDVTGDGRGDLAVGMPGRRHGTVLLYAGTPSGLSTGPISAVAAADLGDNGQLRFGWSLSIADTNADGKADVLVGAPEAGNDGAIVEFRGRASGIASAARRVLRPGAGGIPGVGQANYFGETFATGDANGDGYADLVVGIPYATPNNDPAPQAGMIVVLTGSAGGLMGTGAVAASVKGPAGAQYMGMSVSLLNADGTGPLEILAGAPAGWPYPTPYNGTVYQYRLTGSTLTLIKTTTAEQSAHSNSTYGFGTYALHS